MPVTNWWHCWARVSVWSPSRQVPATLAGTVHVIARHHDVHGVEVASPSGFQSPMSNVFEAIRVPGFNSSSEGRSRRLMSAAGTA